MRLAHLGLGAFFKAHQAWWTDRAPDAADWGYAAFSGRGVADAALQAQEGLFTLVTRAAQGDTAQVVGSVAEVLGSAGPDDWVRVFASPDLAVVTCTVTELGYRRDAVGGLDLDDPDVRADADALRADGTRARPRTAPGKLALGLLVRAEAGLVQPAVVPCDNLPGNGAAVARVLADLARAAGLDDLTHDVPFVSTAVDRITPRTTDEDRAGLLATTGVDDPGVVVTEPYAEWVLAGSFPSGRPAWDGAGARVVPDVEPWERRKLFLLNGSHSLMAYAGPLRGATTVAEAIADDVVRGWVEEWWDDAAPAVGLPEDALAAYRGDLADRYANPRIRHLLAQIALDGWQKLPIRAVPVLRSAQASGRTPTGAARLLAAWVLHLERSGEAAGSVDDVLARLGLDDAEIARWGDLVTGLVSELRGAGRA